MIADRKFLLAHPAHFIAFGFGAGLAKKAPGTWGTLVALPLFAVLHSVGMPAVTGAVIVFLFMVGIWASSVAGKSLGVSDHGGIVIDEIVAFMLVLAFTPMTFWWVLCAFLLFRLFDITKPWPIGLADRKIKGGFGVMFDDLLAAVFSIACIIAAQSLMV